MIVSHRSPIRTVDQAMTHKRWDGPRDPSRGYWGCHPPHGHMIQDKKSFCQISCDPHLRSTRADLLSDHPPSSFLPRHHPSHRPVSTFRLIMENTSRPLNGTVSQDPDMRPQHHRSNLSRWRATRNHRCGRLHPILTLSPFPADIPPHSRTRYLRLSLDLIPCSSREV